MWGLCECFFEEICEALVEELQVLRTGDPVAFVLEGEEFVGDAEFFEGFRGDADVIRGYVWVLQALHDQESSANVVDEVYRRAFPVAFRDLIGGAAHHLLAVGTEVRSGGLIVHDEVRHAADRGGCGDYLRRVVRDRPPRRVSAVGGAGDADSARTGDAGVDKRLDAAPYVLLFPPTPAILLYRLLKRQAEPGAPPIVRDQHVEVS